jgi:hypothetical protein
VFGHWTACGWSVAILHFIMSVVFCCTYTLGVCVPVDDVVHGSAVVS